ncbi:MAG: shikimate kinase [bacterium]|nr:shikimate kinase [bacterium]
MDLIFLYGPVASGKLTIARALAERTGLPVFHNHLIVDAVSALFPFGSPAFVQMRQELWLRMFQAAATADRSLIFTFAPEPTVAADFPARVADIVRQVSGRTLFVALDLDDAEQERRLVEVDRAKFGKLRSIDILRQIREDCRPCMDAMPSPAIRIQTDAVTPAQAAQAIAALISR